MHAIFIANIVHMQIYMEDMTNVGGLEGKVVSISPVPDENGNYIMEIQLAEMPGKQPPTIKVMNGTAEIIINEQSLLKRIFTN